ncbi:hypothetical protein, partial [Undibacterium umbellatum]
ANDSAATSVKVGYRQAFIPHTPAYSVKRGFCFCARNKNKNNKPKQDQKQGQDLSTMRHPDTESHREKQEKQEQARTARTSKNSKNKQEQQEQAKSLLLLWVFGF